MAPSTDPSQWTYTDYACFLNSHGFHNLNTLNEYLQWGLQAKMSPNVRQPEFSRTMLLEFNKGSTRLSDLSDLNKLRLLLREWTRTSKEPSSPGSGQPSGRIIMVDNAAPALIDTLGGLLNIDPSFFANHIGEGGAEPCTVQGPRDQVTIDYQTAFVPVNCPKEVEGMTLSSKSNYYRRVEVIPKQPRQKVAVVRRKISIWLRSSRTQQATDPWLAVVLVDPPLSNFAAGPTSFSSTGPPQSFSVLPYQGGYVDFVEMRKPQSMQQNDYRECAHNVQYSVGNTFDELLRHWQIQARDGLFSPPLTLKPADVGAPALATIARPCLQLAAAETSNTLTFLSNILTSSSPASICTQHPIPNTTTLQRALSRTIFVDALLTTMKTSLSQTKEFACMSTAPNEHIAATYRTLLSSLHAHRSTTDATFSHLTALLTSTHTQALDRIATTSNTSRSHLSLLAVLALVYVPLSLACLIFALPSQLLPSRHYIYGFLPAAVGVALLFLLFGVRQLRQGLIRIKDRLAGGLTRKKVLAGEKFKVHRETGEKVWVNRQPTSTTEFGAGPYVTGGGPIGEEVRVAQTGTLSTPGRPSLRREQSSSSGRGSSKVRAKAKTRERKREAWDEV
ncbi:uncharacterized protein AB675_9642 [Cyphellophora attinorum]|uniref:Uncharacterized protein n=1 Tax=Cyphellophora attinorum TaxID=1664694 RepID=A0A0N1HX37_9EURO|nr:uncharacterized protein AB675_9642 [Phialophora attinorum]KPI42403.1 hypothetical protein AB675_9642 [Phialophora attinorum]